MAINGATGLFAVAQNGSDQFIWSFTGAVGTAIEYQNGEVAPCLYFCNFPRSTGVNILAAAGARDF